MSQTPPNVGKPSKKRRLRLSLVIVFAIMPWLTIGSVLVYDYYEAGLYSLRITYSLYSLSDIGSYNSLPGSLFLVLKMNITNSGYDEVTIYGRYFFAVKNNDIWYGVSEVTSSLSQAGLNPLPSNDTYLFKGDTLSGALCFQISPPLTQGFPRYQDTAHEQFKNLNVVWIHTPFIPA